jgi:hypothetical protein
MRILLFIVVCFLRGNCQSTGTTLFAAPENMGKVTSQLKEASGLVASIENPGKLWTVNDNGNKPEVFLIDGHGRIDLVYTLEKAWNRDWEDIAIGAGPQPGKNYLYVADIGDNKSKHEVEFVYRFPEPKGSTEEKQIIKDYEILIFKLPDNSRDAETLIIDPKTNDLFIVSKREDSVRVYQALYPFAGDTVLLSLVCKLAFKSIVGGSISADGSEVLLKSYKQIFYWKRSSQTIPQLLIQPPVVLTYEPEFQGEGIAWSRDNTGFYTLSESGVVKAQLKFYRRK